MQDLTPSIRINTSQLWETNTGIIQGPEGVILVDPGVFQPELEVIAAAGPVVAGFCTHAHWDHVLWHSSFGEDVPRYASSETIALMHKERDALMRSLEGVEKQLHERGDSDGSEQWNRDLLFKEHPVAWGTGSIAGVDVEVIPVPGHEDGQAALLLPDHGVCFVADTLSDIEIPSFQGGSRAIYTYLHTLDRLQSVIDRVAWIVPGHGKPADRTEAQRRLDADRRYLEALVPMVDSAPEEEGAEDLARRIITELGEERAQPGLSAKMHLDNVRQLIAEREQRNADLPVRRSSRLLLLDTNHRVWMLRINDPIRPRWILPGGGLEEGESWEQAARRELWEECAIDDAEIGPMVATRDRVQVFEQFRTPDGKITSGETWVHVEERYFLMRINSQEPQGSNMTAHESGHYTGQAWFSAEDIRASNEIVYPLGLADLLDQLRQGSIPANPWQWRD